MHEVWILYDAAKHPAYYYATCHSDKLSITLAEPNTNFIWSFFQHSNAKTELE